jgi:hypothetical protein
MKYENGLHRRHAYLAQLYGTVNTANLHAAVFHDGQDSQLLMQNLIILMLE